ncbi:MAG: hypothetical protein DA330_09530 [Nitrososphaera sp.]|nr:hypothetical protein [Nitrososphaera sp.]
MARSFTQSSTDRIDCGASLNAATGTLAIWMYNTGQTSNFRLIAGNRTGSTGYVLRLDSDETPDFFIYMNGTIRRLNASATAIPINSWSVIVFEWQDGASAAIESYINDMTTADDSTSGNFGSYDNSAINFQVGDVGAGGFCAGMYAARACVWNIKLTETDRKMFKAGHIPRRENLLIHQEIIGVSTEPDWSGQGHNGTVTGTGTVTVHAPVGRYAPAPRHWPIFVSSGLSAVSNTSTHLFNIIAQVSQTSTHKFHIAETVSQTSAHLFNIFQQVAQTSTHIFNIREIISNTSTHKFNIAEIVAQTSTHIFNIASSLTAVSNTLTSLFHIRQEVSQTSTHKFNVMAQIAQTSTHIFNILSSAAVVIATVKVRALRSTVKVQSLRNTLKTKILRHTVKSKELNPDG